MRYWQRSMGLILLAVICLSVSGLASETWIQWYEHEDEVHIGTVIDWTDEYWLIGSHVASLDPPDAGIVVFQIQPNGGLLSTFGYDWDGVQSAADAFVDSEGDVIFVGQTDTYGAVGSDMYVLRTDSSGQTLAEGVFGESLEESAHLIVLGSHGDYFIVGNQTNPEDRIADAGAAGYGGLEFRCAPYVVRMQPSGAPVWKQTYRSEDNIVVFDATATSDGGCLILSTVYGYPNADDAIRLDKVNEWGDIAWSRTFDDGNSKGYSLLQLANGRLLIAGAHSSEGGGLLQPLLILLEADGSEVWSHTYVNIGLRTAAHQLIETRDGLFVAVGTRFGDYAEYRDDVYLLCVNADGVLQWEASYSMGKHVMVEALCELADGDLLIAGTGAAANQRFQAMLMRVDPPEEAETP